MNFAGNLFVSKKQLLDLIIHELGPNPTHFAGWPCPISICAHNQSTRFAAAKDEVLKQDLKSLELAGAKNGVDQNFLASYYQNKMVAYHDGGYLSVGTRLTSLKSKSHWQGEGGLEGRGAHILPDIKSDGTICMKYRADYISSTATILWSLSGRMSAASVELHQAMHDHLREELTKLEQMYIAENEAMLLVSEEIALIFKRFFAERSLAMRFEEGGNTAEFLADILWVNLKVLVAAKELLKDGLKYHPLLSAAFIRFLTKQTGANADSGLGGQLTELKTYINEAVRGLASVAVMDNKLAPVKSTADSAKTTAISAKGVADGAKTVANKTLNLVNAVIRVNQLKKE